MLTYQKEPATDEQIHSVLHPLMSKWFKDAFGTFSPPQQYGIMPIHRKENTLIFAPTGTGKTLTAFTSILNELVTLSDEEKLEEKVYCIYVCPLKALSRDIKRNLLDPLTAIKEASEKKMEIRVETRTGDTPSHVKSKMLKKVPHILITTPESLAIVLTAPKFRKLLDDTRWVIIDEIHSLATGKRGVHLSLSLERLSKTANFSRIGLSATVSPLDDVAHYLVGLKDGVPRDCTIVDTQFVKDMDLKVLSPVDNIIETDHKTMHRKMYELVDSLVQQHKTTLIFTNTRAATERVVHTLKDWFPKNYTQEGKSLIGAHHGSLSAEHRIGIERSLKKGDLKCIVSSTSLELGIDIGHIDLVILLGSPKSVARGLQRIGRSGHRLRETAKGRIIVLDRDDLVECAVLLKSAIEKKIDRIRIPENALDVLSQQIYGMAIVRRWDIEELYATIRSSYNYRNLSRDDFDSVIAYLSGEHVSLEDRYVYAKIWHDPDKGMVGRRGRLARVIYMSNIGTIPDESYALVKIGDDVVGKVEEGFLERLKKGDVFVLGGDTYEFLYTRGMVARVRASAGRPPTVPSWFSEMLPLSYDLACEIQRFRKHMADRLESGKSREEMISFIDGYLYVDTYGANSIYEYFNEQYSFSKIPHINRLVVERFREEKKKHIIFHTLFGRRVNDVLSRALAFAAARLQNRDVEMTINDNGFMLSYAGTLNIKKAFQLVMSTPLKDLMKQALEQTEILKRRFRHCATRSLMVLKRYHGKEKTVGKQQMSSNLLLNSVKKISNDFPILKEARREILEDLMDIKSAEEVLSRLDEGELSLLEVALDFPSPFAFNLILQGYTDVFKVDDKVAFLRRMHERVKARIAKEKETRPFSYSELWDDLLEQRRIERQDNIEEMKVQAANFPIPLAVREEVMKIIDNKEDLRKDIIDELLEGKYGVFGWDDPLGEEMKKKLKELDEKTILLRQLNKGAYKSKLDRGVQMECKELILGIKTDGFSDTFKLWLDELLKGPISYAWGTELIKFLIEKKKEMK